MDRPDPVRETAPAVCRALIFTMRERYGANDRPAVYGNSTQHAARPGPTPTGSARSTSRNQDSRLDDNDERREGLSSVREEQNTDRDNSRDERELGENRDRDERESTGRNQRSEAGEYNEQGARREQRPAAMAAGMDTFAPVLEAWKQVFKSWSELTETMVKVQQDAFASMISGANAHAKDLNLGENRNGERAFSSGSRTTASTPERIDRDRR